MAQYLEIMMLLSFGAAWPTAIMKSYQVRTAKGKSLAFMLIIEFGYICGIGAKIIGGNVNYVVAFYMLNFLMIFTDILLYFRNKALDKAAEESGAKCS